MPDCKKLLLVAAFYCASLTASADEECLKTIGFIDEFPFATMGADKKAHGINVDLITEALKRVGCAAQFVNLPVPRGLLYLQSGSIDMFSGVIKTDERAKYAHFSVPFTRSPMYIYLSDKSQLPKNLETLADFIGTNLRIGVLNNRAYGTDFIKLSKNPEFAKRLNSVNNQDSVWRMIGVGRLDATISDATTANADLLRLGLTNTVHRSSIVVSNDADHVAFSKKNVDSEFVDRFNAAFSSMLLDGSFTKIWQSYIDCKVSVKNLGCE